MITWWSKWRCQVSDVISTEILEEVYSNLQFTSGLSCRFRTYSLDSFNEEIEDFFVVKGFSNSSVDFAKHQVSFLVFEWIMETSFWYILKFSNEFIKLSSLSIRLGSNNITIHWIDDFFLQCSLFPLTINKIISLIALWKIVNIYCSKCLN